MKNDRPRGMKKVLFICQANIGRSQMAEVFYNFVTNSNQAGSAGVQDFRKKYNFHPTQEIIDAMNRKNIDLSKQRIKVISNKMLKQFEKIVVFCDKSLCPKYLLENNKVLFHLIDDTHKRDSKTINNIRDEIEEFVLQLVKNESLNNLQNSYENKIGSAQINIDSAVVGKQTTLKITYTIGELGIDESGGFKLLFRTAGDCADIQTIDENKPNFVKISSTNLKSTFLIDTKSNGFKGKVHDRPWSRGFSVTIATQYLSKGDKVFIDFKNWRTQTFAEKKHELKIVVDPFASGRCIELPNSPAISLKSDKISRLVLLGPSKIKPNKSVDIFIKAEDKWGNPATNFSEEVEVSELDTSETHLNLSTKVKLDNGVASFNISSNIEGFVAIGAKYKNITAKSNPILVTKNLDEKIFWADLHGQSEETIGTNDATDYFDFAKDYSYLDVSCIQGNDFQITNDFWKKINKVTKKINKQGKFIAFPGYEWSGNTNRGGDRNVIYLNEGEKIFRSSHALLNNFEDVSEDVTHVNELFSKLNPKNTIVIPHVGGRYADLNFHDPKLEPVVEIHSAWGTFEWLFFDALKQGYKVGVVANSDDHSGRLGSSYPAFDHFNSIGGLTGIISKKLDRKTIFDAIKKRNCFATTGNRPFVDFSIANNSNKVIMGEDIILERGDASINFEYFGTSAIEKVEVFAFDSVIHTQFTNVNEKLTMLKVLWSGSNVRGRARKFDWNGTLSFESAEIKSIEKINFFSQRNSIKNNKNTITWNGMTTGGVQGFIINIDRMSGQATLNINDKEIKITLEKLPDKPIVLKMGGLDAKIAIYKTTTKNATNHIRFSKKMSDLLKDENTKSKNEVPIFVKVTQRDGHMVWTSPIFVK